MFTHLSAPDPHVLRNKQIVSGFYSYVRLTTAGPEPREINTSADLAECWTSYLGTLPENDKASAQALTYITTHSSQVIPENFTYADALKASFLIAIPDLALYKHTEIMVRGSREDEFLRGLQHSEPQQGQSYTLSIGEDNQRQCETFDTFITKKQMLQSASDLFKKFADFLQAQTSFDRYAVAKFSYLFSEDVRTIIESILSDPHVSTVITIAQLDYVECIGILHNVLGWWLDVYISKKNPFPRLPDEFTEDELTQYKKNVGHLKKYQLHINTARNLYRCFTTKGTVMQIMAAYQKHTLHVMSVIIASAITRLDQMLQENCYNSATTVRKAFITKDELNYNGVRMELGLADDEDYTKFICDDYAFSDYIFTNLTFKGLDNQDKIVNYFFVSSMDVLNPIDKTKVEKLTYEFILQRLWNAFINDKRFPVNLTDIDLEIDARLLIQKNTESTVLTKELLRTFNGKEKEQIISEEDSILHDLRKTIRGRNHNNPYLSIIIELLKCPSLTFKHRLAIASSVATQRAESAAANENTRFVYNGLINIGKTISENNVAILVDRYSIAQFKGHDTQVLKTQIASLCSWTQLEILKSHLACFSPPKSTQTFFTLRSEKHPFEKIVSMIKKQRHPAEILLELKRRVQVSKSLSAQIDNMNPIKDFFNVDDASSGKTTKMLLLITEQASQYVISYLMQQASGKDDGFELSARPSSISPGATPSSGSDDS